MAAEPLSPEALRKKELHYRSMVWTGFFMTACGLAAAYLAFSTGPIPSLFFGRLRAGGPPAQGKSRKTKPMLASFRPWGKAALEEARTSGKLVFLDVCVTYNRACALMDEATYADASVVDLIDRRFIAVRVDADERPDVAARYQSGGWPSTVILTPEGRPLGRATFLTPGLLKPWAASIADAYEKRKGQPLPEPEAESKERDQLRPDAVGNGQDLSRAWDNEGPRFPHFDWIARLQGPVADHARASVLALEDKVWGGFFRCADGPGWSNPETEKILADQAQAILAGVEPQKTLAYVDRFLSAKEAGYYASQACEVRKGDEVVEGRYYYGAGDREKLGLPEVDRRIFVGINSVMIRAALTAGSAVQKRRAYQTLQLIWRGAGKGMVPHQLGDVGSVRGLLIDEVSLGRALLAAGEVAKAREVAQAMDRTLLDEKSGAYFDRPSLGELPAAFDRVLFPSQNFEAYEFLRQLPGSRLDRLKSWLESQSARLDPVARAALSANP